MGSNTYDFENHLVAAGGVSVVYDGDGNRVKESVATTTTSYLVADANLTGFAQVVDELQNGSVSRTYSYGLSLISQRLTANGQGLSFYGFDGHGSVRFLTSSTGAITDTYNYDAFGSLISSTGSTPNNYLFAGEQFDPLLGIYYNRARYYDQRQGRFWSMDMFEGDPESPASLHKYLYASGDPIDRIDPSGHEDIVSVVAAVSIAATLNNIEFVNGMAVMDQIKYGGNAGLKSLVIGTLVTLFAPLAITIIGKGILRLAPTLVRIAGPARVIANELNAEEAELAEEVVKARGGVFTGQIKANTPGIDGFLGEIPASLKTFTTDKVRNMRSELQDALGDITKAGYVDAEVFAWAKNISAHDIFTADNGGILDDILVLTKSGVIKAVNILTKEGQWLHFQ